jgi:4-aminobutyrate aminotransferase-like enzyme
VVFRMDRRRLFLEEKSTQGASGLIAIAVRTNADSIKFAPRKNGCCSPHMSATPSSLSRGEGVHIIDEQGDRYLDLLSGIGVNALGYGHPVD